MTISAIHVILFLKKLLFPLIQLVRYHPPPNQHVTILAHLNVLTVAALTEYHFQEMSFKRVVSSSSRVIQQWWNYRVFFLCEIHIPQIYCQFYHPVIGAEGSHIPHGDRLQLYWQVFGKVAQPIKLILNATQELSFFKSIILKTFLSLLFITTKAQSPQTLVSRQI